jgi:phage RecT family recombinase
MAIDIRSKTQEVVAAIDTPAFLQQIEDSLPEGVSMQRFVSVAKTAVRTNPDLATADQTSLFGSIVRCAQDGLLPDGREAALVIYKGKVGYIPMIGGIRRIAAVYGWQIRTNVVYENDEFDYTDEPPEILHRPVRPGQQRGQLIAAYAVATHRDGRRMQTVLHPEDVAKRKAKAQTTKVWDEFTAAMWEKSAGHDIFGQLSLDPADARVDRILREGILADPLQALYGVKKTDDLRADPEPQATPDGDGRIDGSAKLEEAVDLGQAASSPEPEDGVWTPVEDEVDEAEVEKAAQTVVKGGNYNGQTFAQIATDDLGATWLLRQLKKTPPESPHFATLALFVEQRLPEVWAKYQAAKAAA